MPPTHINPPPHREALANFYPSSLSFVYNWAVAGSLPYPLSHPYQNAFLSYSIDGTQIISHGLSEVLYEKSRTRF